MHKVNILSYLLLSVDFARPGNELAVIPKWQEVVNFRLFQFPKWKLLCVCVFFFLVKEYMWLISC